MTTVLVVDDDDAMRDLLKQVFTGAGYEVLEAGNGNKAGLVYALHRPDLVITDLIMPDGEGLELIMALRGQYKGVKIIAMSEGRRGGRSNYLLTAKRLGADYTIEKPFSIDEFLSIVRLAIETGPTSPAMAIASNEKDTPIENNFGC